MKIDVAAIAGPHCITAEDGEIIFQMIHTALARGETVELDFNGTEVFSSPFFNAAIGPLLRDHTADELNARIILLRLAVDGLAVLKRVIKNSREYFTDDTTRRAVDDQLADPGQ